MSDPRVVIVGAGAAGLSVAETLRRQGFTGSVTLIGAEDATPYDRPPLSKQYLAGTWDASNLELRTTDAIDLLNLDLRLGVSALAVDSEARTVTLSDGGTAHYDALAITTGVSARRLPGTEGIGGVHTLRTLADVDGLRESIGPGQKLVVVGAGFLGSEAAAVTRELGAKVTLVSDLPAPLADVIGPEIGASAMLMEKHRAHGVRVETGAIVTEILEVDGRAAGVRLRDGRTIAADAVLVAIGSIPATGWLTGSGIPVATSAPGVCCATRTVRPLRGCGRPVTSRAGRTPTTGIVSASNTAPNAAEQGAAVARNILADFAAQPQTPFAPIPYIWSDQYDLNIQIYGLPRVRDEVVIVEGSPAGGKLLALYGKDSKVCAALGINMIPQIRRARQLVAARAPMPRIEVPTP